MTLSERFQKVIDTLDSSDKPLSAKEISKSYMENPGHSEALSVLTICNILAEAGILVKNKYKHGKSFRVTFILASKVNGIVIVEEYP